MKFIRIYFNNDRFLDICSEDDNRGCKVSQEELDRLQDWFTKDNDNNVLVRASSRNFIIFKQNINYVEIE